MARAKGHSILLGERGQALLRILSAMDGSSYSQTVSKALVLYARSRLDLAGAAPDMREFRDQLREAMMKEGR